MGPRPVRTAAALVAVLAASTMAGPAPSGGAGSLARSEILVGFEPGVGRAAQREVLANLGADPRERFRPIRAFRASVPAAERRQIIAALERDSRVRYAEPNVTFRISAEPNDPSFGELWGLDNS